MKMTVADLALSHPQTDAAADTLETAVADFHIFAGFVISQTLFIGADSHTVIPCIDIAVFNQDIGAAVHIETVSIHHIGIPPDCHIVHMDPVTSVKETVPVLGILKADILDLNVAAAAEKDHLRHAPLREFIMGMCSAKSHNIFRIKNGMVIPVDGAFAGKGDIFAFVGNNKVGTRNMLA